MGLDALLVGHGVRHVADGLCLGRELCRSRRARGRVSRCLARPAAAVERMGCARSMRSVSTGRASSPKVGASLLVGHGVRHVADGLCLGRELCRSRRARGRVSSFGSRQRCASIWRDVRFGRRCARCLSRCKIIELLCMKSGLNLADQLTKHLATDQSAALYASLMSAAVVPAAAAA